MPPGSTSGPVASSSTQRSNDRHLQGRVHRHLGERLPRERVRVAQQVGPGLELDELHSLGDLGVGLVGPDAARDLELSQHLPEAESRGERLACLVALLDPGREDVAPVLSGRDDDALEERAAEPPATVLGQDDVAHVRAAWQVGADGGGAAGDRPVDPADEAQVVGPPCAAPLQLVRGDRVARDDGVPEGRIRLVPRPVPRRELRDLELDVHRRSYPDRFSFPCRLAYTSPRLKIARPSGMLAAPITRSGQMSCHSEPSDAPSRIEARIPSSA